MVGYILSIGIYMGLFYSNTWQARNFPFISPLLFSEKSTAKKYVTYPQNEILDKNYRVDESLLAKQGLPFLTASHALSSTTLNIGIMAAITHMILWHWNDIKSAFDFISVFNLQSLMKPKEWDLKFWNTRRPR